MLPTGLSSKLRKIIDMTSDKALIDGTYFSPLFTDRLADKVPELRELNFNLSKTETESDEGTVISGLIVAPNQEKLSLGSVLLDGKTLVVQKSLITPDKLISFIEDNVPQEF